MHCSDDAIKIGEANILAVLLDLDALGNRFARQTRQRDGEMWKIRSVSLLQTKLRGNVSTNTRRGVMNLHESGADMEVPVSNMEDSTEAHFISFRKQILMEDPTPCPRVVIHGMKPPAKLVEESCFSITSFREPISQQSPISSLQ